MSLKGAPSMLPSAPPALRGSGSSGGGRAFSGSSPSSSSPSLSEYVRIRATALRSRATGRPRSKGLYATVLTGGMLMVRLLPIGQAAGMVVLRMLSADQHKNARDLSICGRTSGGPAPTGRR